MRWSQLAVTAAALAATLTPAAPAAAWGNLGHTIIVRAAVQRLEARRPGITGKIKALYAHGLLTETFQTGPNSKLTCRANDLDQLATWADCVRNSPPEVLGLTRPDHFDDAPLSAPLDATTPRTWCDEGCATKAISEFIAILRDKNAPPKDRARALAFVIHFVGDLHQPLHGEDNDDRGGNDVTFPNPNIPKPGQKLSPMSLHSYWDTYLVGQAVGDLGPAVKQIKGKAKKAGTLPAGTPDDAEFRAWLIESHAVAVDAYRQLGLDGKTGKQKLKAPPPPAYLATFKPQVADRLTLATLRLEAILDAAIS